MAKDGSNWYSYCNNDPVNNIDSTGLYSSMQAYEDALREAEYKFSVKTSTTKSTTTTTTTTKSQVQITGGYTSQHAPSFPSPYSWEQNFAKAEEKFWAEQTPTYIVPDITPTNPNTQNSQEFFNDVVFDTGMQLAETATIDYGASIYYWAKKGFTTSIDDFGKGLFSQTIKGSFLDGVGSIKGLGLVISFASSYIDYKSATNNGTPWYKAAGKEVLDLGIDIGISALVFGIAGMIGAPAVAATIVSIGVSAIVSNLLDRAFA